MAQPVPVNPAPASTQADAGGHVRQHSHYRAILSLVLVVLILSSFGPAAKFVLNNSDITPFELACTRVLIGLAFLCMTVCVYDRPSVVLLAPREIGLLSVLGLLCVGIPYALSAWGLQHTTVINYVLIYSLVPSFTALFSYFMGKERLTTPKLTGIFLSLVGCVVAVSEGFARFSNMSFGFDLGEGLIALFALMMSASIVASAKIVMRYGAMTANTVMFGSSFVFLFIGNLIHEPPPREPISFLTAFTLIYIGITTAGVFLLRFFALRSLSPSTVGAFHNLVPVCTIFLAVVFLHEPLANHTILGTLAILAGVELVRRNAWIGKRKAAQAGIAGWSKQDVPPLPKIARM